MLLKCTFANGSGSAELDSGLPMMANGPHPQLKMWAATNKIYAKVKFFSFAQFGVGRSTSLPHTTQSQSQSQSQTSIWHKTASRAAIIMIIIICAIDVVCCVRYGIHLWPLYLYIEWFWIGSICGPVVHSPSSLCTRTRHFYFLAHWHGDRSFLSSLCLCLCLCLHVSLFTLCFACPCNGKRTEPAMPKWRSRAKLLCTRAMRSPPHTKCPEPSQWCARKTRQARARQNSRQRPMMVFDTHANCT